MLDSVYIDRNSFTGTIPSEIGLLTKLWYGLYVSENQLFGTVPAELSSLSDLKNLGLFGNNLTGSLDMFCNQTAMPTKIEADCGGLDPAVECSCCISCCDSSSGNCTLNIDSVCQVEQSWFEDENGPEYYESGGTVCECSIDPDSDNDAAAATLSCTDTQCQSCNINGTVCFVNERYQTTYDDYGERIHFHSAFQYVVGRNDTVTFDARYFPDYTSTCEVAVNGQVCNDCYWAICDDGFAGVYVSCENVEGAGYAGLCDERTTDDDGPLAVFALQDPAFLQGCPPRLSS
jgi:hypothetical protein